MTTISSVTSAQSIGSPAGVTDVVLLIHGIRDRAGWNQKIAAVLSDPLKRPTVKVIPIKYGYYNVIRFLTPFDWFVGPPTDKVLRQIYNAKQAYPNARISVIAHSFGTYLITRILSIHQHIELFRLILCGAVLKQSFQWERISRQIGGNDPDKRKYIVNDCGSADIWPPLASSAGWGYGNAGTDGCGHAFVTDRFHKGGHSLFLSPEFATKYWGPFIDNGELVDGGAVQGEGVPWYVRLLQGAYLRLWPLIAIIALLVYLISVAFVAETREQDPIKFMDFVRQAAQDRENNGGNLLEVLKKSGHWIDWDCEVHSIDLGQNAYYIRPKNYNSKDVAAERIKKRDLELQLIMDYDLSPDGGGFNQKIRPKPVSVPSNETTHSHSTKEQYPLIRIAGQIDVDEKLARVVKGKILNDYSESIERAVKE